MDLFSLIIILVVLGLILWLIEQLPIDATIVRIIRVVVIVVVVLWLLRLVVPAFPIHAIR